MTEDAPREPVGRANLEAIEARYEAATPGPWFDDFWKENPALYHIIWIGSKAIGEIGRHQRTDQTRVAADAAFIVNARTDVPALVAEVRRLREGIRTYLDAWADYYKASLVVQRSIFDGGIEDAPIEDVNRANDKFAAVDAARKALEALAGDPHP